MVAAGPSGLAGTLAKGRVAPSGATAFLLFVDHEGELDTASI